MHLAFQHISQLSRYKARRKERNVDEGHYTKRHQLCGEIEVLLSLTHSYQQNHADRTPLSYTEEQKQVPSIRATPERQEIPTPPPPNKKKFTITLQTHSIKIKHDDPPPQQITLIKTN